MYTDQLAITTLRYLERLKLVGKQALGNSSKSVCRMRPRVYFLICSISDTNLILYWFLIQNCNIFSIELVILFQSVVSYDQMCGCVPPNMIPVLFSSSAVFLFVPRSSHRNLCNRYLVYHIRFLFMRKGILMYLGEFTQIINTIK